MKIAIWFLLAFIFSVPAIFCNDGLLSKFHQHGYKLKDVRMQLISYDENYFNNCSVKAFKYNRTTTAHNGTMNFKKNVHDKVEVLVQFYKFLSNEYRHFPARFQVNLKKAVEADVIGLGKLKDCGNMTNFYFYKDITYYYCNFVIDETRCPPLIPDGRYKIEINFLYLNLKTGLMHLFFEVYTPVEYPKKPKLNN